MKPIYSHRQFGTVIVVACSLTLLGTLVLGALHDWPAPLLGVGLVLAAVLVLGYRMEVVVDDTAVRIALGIGLLRKTFPLRQIRTAEASRHGVIAGWGIRWTPGGGWMWCVSGVHSVALGLEGGGKFRIGTDDPDGLSRAIQSAIGTTG